MKKTIEVKKGEAAKPLSFLDKKCPECGKKKMVKGRAAIQCDNCGHSEPLIPNKPKPDVDKPNRRAIEKEEAHEANKYDSGDFEQEEATEDQLAKIKNAGLRAAALEKQIEDLTAAAAMLTIDRDTILNKTLPALMDSAGMPEFSLDDGSSFEIKDVVSGTLPSATTKPKEREKALAWLFKNGGKGLIKTNFKTEFGVGQEKLVEAFEKLITKSKFVAKKEIGVHPQTLCAFVRELLEDGKKVPIETLGIYVGRHAKLKLSSEAVKKAESERIKPKRHK